MLANGVKGSFVHIVAGTQLNGCKSSNGQMQEEGQLKVSSFALYCVCDDTE
jgi:hypothetical protein